MYVENRMKIANFPTPVYLTPPMKGFPVEFGIGVRGPKCLNDGPQFSDRFSRFDTIPAVTDDSQLLSSANTATGLIRIETVMGTSCKNVVKLNYFFQLNFF